jgi:hypothetical protein
MLGPQQFEDIIQMGVGLNKCAKDGVIDRIVVDLTAMGYPDIGARRAALRLAKQLHYNHVALVRNGSSLNNALVLFIARQSGHVHEIEVFSSREAALEWLCSR